MGIDNVYGENTEMYLKTLVELAADREVVPVTGLAERLGISTVSASEKVRRLQDRGFVQHLPYKGVSLTEAGLKRANTVLRRHRLWERFLVDHLGVEWQHAHDAACRLEHATNREISEKLAAYLKQPAYCPHGNPIPGAVDPPGDEPGLNLNALNEPAGIVVLRVFPESTNLLAEVFALGLIPGAAGRLSSPRDDEGNVRVSIGGDEVLISEETSRHLYVRVVDGVTA